MGTTETERRAALVDVAASIFLRYGFRKASMDDVARAARISRQGLYLYFSTKEDLFREVVKHLASAARETVRVALERSDLDLEERIFGALAAMYTGEINSGSAEELFSTAAELAREIVIEHDRAIVSALARELKAEGSRAAGLSPHALAEHLYLASYGLKLRRFSGEEYLAHLRTAVRIVCRAAGWSSIRTKGAVRT